MRRMAGSLTLVAGALILLALPLVIGATQNVQNERFTGLMLAALVACIIALVLTRTAQRMTRNARGSAAPAVPPSVGDEGRD